MWNALQPPRLVLLALLLGPNDRLPVRREDEARAGIGDLDAVAAGLPNIEEEGLLDRVLVRVDHEGMRGNTTDTVITFRMRWLTA